MFTLGFSVLFLGVACTLFAYWLVRRTLPLFNQGDAPMPAVSSGQWFEEPMVAQTIQAVGIAVGRIPALRSFERKYEALLADARWPRGLTPVRLIGMATIGGVAAALAIGLFLGQLFGPLAFPIGLIVIPFAYPIVSAALKGIATERLATIHLDFPYVIDLLALSLGAGSNLLLSLDVISKTYDEHPIGYEIKQLIFDIKLGKPHSAAFASLAERVPLSEVQMLSQEITQAEQLGTKVADALMRLSEALRMRRMQEARDKAGQARVKIIIPGGLVFLSVLLLLFSPIILKALEGGLDL